MMTLRIGNVLILMFAISVMALTSCESIQNVVENTVQPEDNMVEEIPVKFVLLIDYPEGQKDAYIAWVASVAATLQAPEEIDRIRSYDNLDQTMSPHRLVEFEFKSYLDAATYLNRPEIAGILGDIPNHASKVRAHTFIQRSDYEKVEDGNWQVKTILLIDYPLGGKQAYLDWVDSVSSITVGPPQLKAIKSYDNYYGESPHRLVEFEFANSDDSTTYSELEDIMALEVELDVQTGSWIQHTFELRSDYINE